MGNQKMKWTSTAGGSRTRAWASKALITEFGKCYRVTGQIRRGTAPSGIAVEARIGNDADPLGNSSVERGTLGQSVVFADETWQQFEVRWVDWTNNGTSWFHLYTTEDWASRGSPAAQFQGLKEGDEIEVKDLVAEAFPDTLEDQPYGSTRTATTVQKHGVSLTFNRAVSVKKYVNGDLEIADPNLATLQVVSTWPAGNIQNFTLTPSSTNYNATPTAAATAYQIRTNGMVRNPWPAGWEMTGTSLAGPNGQAFDDYMTGVSIIGKFVEQPYSYDGKFNIDPGITGSPVTVGSACTLVKAMHARVPLERMTSAQGGGGETRARLLALVPFTIVSAHSATGSFRPHPGLADKTPPANISDMDLSVLPSRALPDGISSPFTAGDAIRTASYMFPFWVRQFPSVPGFVPSMCVGVYSENTSDDVSKFLFAPMYLTGLTSAERERVAIGIIQAGLDLQQDNRIRINPWAESGGKTYFHRALVALTALLMRGSGIAAQIEGDLTNTSGGQYDVRLNPGLAANDRRYPWTENCTVGRITPLLVDTPRRAGGSVRGTRRHMMWFPECVGLAFMGDTIGSGTYAPWTENNANVQNSWATEYQMKNGGGDLWLTMLAIHAIPGLRAVYDHPPIIELYDRAWQYYARNGNKAFPPPDATEAALWRAYRSTGAPVAANNLGLTYIDKTGAEVVSLMAKDWFFYYGTTLTLDNYASAIRTGGIEGIAKMRSYPTGAFMSFDLKPEWYDIAGTSDLNAATIPTSYTLVSGSLPTGLTLNATTGVISGTPTAPSPLRSDLPQDPTDRDRKFTIRATDLVVRASNGAGDSEQTIRFAVVPA